MQHENDRLAAARTLVGEQPFEAFAAIPVESPEGIAEGHTPVDPGNDSAVVILARTPAERGFDHPWQPFGFTERLLVFEGLRLDLGFGEAGKEMILTDEAEIVRLDGFAVGLQSMPQACDVGALGFARGAKERRELGSCQLGLIEHTLLFCRAGKAAQFADEFPDGSSAAMILIAADMRGDIPLQPCRVVPMRRGRIAGSPFFPGRARWLALDLHFAIPFDADPQMRVEPDEVVGDL